MQKHSIRTPLAVPVAVGTGVPGKLSAEKLPSDKLSPMMRQFAAAKAAHPDALLFFRMGDFYELFYEDAVVASRELQLTLTARDREKSQPMCGVPYHAADGYLQKLLRRGFRIAICEQMEDPKLTKTIVRREVTRVLTPGTALDPQAGAGENTFLAALSLSAERNCAGVALLDLSTGEFRTTEFRGSAALRDAAEEVARNRPREVLLPAGLRFGNTQAEFDGSEPDDDLLASVRTRTPVEDWAFTPEYALPLLQGHYRAHSLEGFGLGARTSAAAAAGALLHYLRATKHEQLEHLDVPRFYERSTCLELDAVSVRNLELIEPLFSGETQQTTLCYALDACRTPMGKRLLRAVLLRPSINPEEIAARHDAVGEAARMLTTRERLRRSLEGVLDLERLLGRLALDSAGPREVVALGRTLTALPLVLESLSELSQGRFLTLASGFDTLADVATRIAAVLVDESSIAAWRR